MANTNPYISVIEVELNHLTKGYCRALKDTLSYFRDVTSYLIHVTADHFEEFRLCDSQSSLTHMEKLVHKTKDNPNPQYETFDKIFYKYPSNYRRAAIHVAVGHVSSHETRCDDYYEYRDVIINRGHHFRKMEPAFTYTPNSCPTLYKKACYSFKGNKICIKVRIRNTWDWIDVSIPNRDLKCLNKAISCGGDLKNPKLVYKYHKFYLQFPVQWKSVSWDKLPIDAQKILSLDRGINHGGVFSIVDSFGTVYKRGFDPFSKDMDRITHIINKIRKASKQSGRGQKLSSLYTKLSGLKTNYVRQLARWVVNNAIDNNVYGVLLEHLGKIKQRKGIKARIHHWVTAKLRDLIKGMCARYGIRVFIVNPKNTSCLAYDGTGKIKRGKDAGFASYEWCKFKSGKIYNCDLNASYNIASRYFLREFKKSISAKEWSALLAKVPDLSKRTNWTLSTLVKTSVLLYPEKACAA